MLVLVLPTLWPLMFSIYGPLVLLSKFLVSFNVMTGAYNVGQGKTLSINFTVHIYKV